MRHRKRHNHLSRKTAHRRSMFANMASSLILNKRITTTTAKAKALRSFVEPLITRSKNDNTHSRRIAFRNLKDKHAVSELFRDVAVKSAQRPGGYTRIIKLGNRLGDNSEMAMIELVDYNENLLTQPKETKTKTRRGRRGGKKSVKAQPAGEQEQAFEKAEETKTEEKSPGESEVKQGQKPGEAREEKPEEAKPEEKSEEKPEMKAGGSPRDEDEKDGKKEEKEQNKG